MSKVIITVKGGLIEEIRSDNPGDKFIIVDYDNHPKAHPSDFEFQRADSKLTIEEINYFT